MLINIKHNLAEKKHENMKLDKKNNELTLIVDSLKKDNDNIEIFARKDLGLVNGNEVYYQFG